jgi:hypothetical protein
VAHVISSSDIGFNEKEKHTLVRMDVFPTPFAPMTRTLNSPTGGLLFSLGLVLGDAFLVSLSSPVPVLRNSELMTALRKRVSSSFHTTDSGCAGVAVIVWRDGWAGNEDLRMGGCSGSATLEAGLGRHELQVRFTSMT